MDQRGGIYTCSANEADEVSEGGRLGQTLGPLYTLMDELTQQVLGQQPSDIPLFIAEYLEEKLRDRDHKAEMRERAVKVAWEEKERYRHNFSPDTVATAARGRPSTGLRRQSTVDLPRHEPTESGDEALSAGDETDSPSLGDSERLRLIRQATSSGLQERFAPRDEVSIAPEAIAPKGADIMTGRRPTESVNLSPSKKTLPHSGDQLVSSIRGHTAAITRINALGSYVLTSSLDETVRVWPMNDSAQCVRQLLCKSPVYDFICLRYKTKKYVLLAGCKNGTVMSWKIKLGTSVKANYAMLFRCNIPNPITTLDASPDRLHLATGCCYPMHEILGGRLLDSVRGSVKLWDLETFMEASLQPEQHDGNINCRHLRTAKQLVGIDRHCMRRKASATAFAALADSDRDAGVLSLSFSPDASVIAVGLGQPHDSAPGVPLTGAFVICCVQTMETLWIYNKGSPHVTRLLCLNHKDETDANKFIVLASTPRALFKFTVKTHAAGTDGKKVQVSCEWDKALDHRPSAFCLSPNKSHVLSSSSVYSQDGECTETRLHHIDMSSGLELTSVNVGKEHPSAVSDLAYSADGSLICIGSPEGPGTLCQAPDLDSVVNHGPASGNKRRQTERHEHDIRAGRDILLSTTDGISGPSVVMDLAKSVNDVGLRSYKVLTHEV